MSLNTVAEPKTINARRYEKAVVTITAVTGTAVFRVDSLNVTPSRNGSIS